MKDKLIFDTTDATTRAETDNVGAYLRASDGTLLTHTDVGGKKALDVRVAEGINVEVDLAHTDDSVRLGDGTDFFTSHTVGADVGLDVYILNSSLSVTQGTSPWVIGDGGGSITVDATDLDIRDLVAASDSVSAWTKDGAGNSIGSTGGSLNVNITNSLTVNDAALANTAIENAANLLDVANTAEAVVAAALANRKYLFVYNKGNQTMYIGKAGVTAANGFPVSPGSYMELRAGAAVAVNFVSAKLNHEIRTMELS